VTDAYQALAAIVLAQCPVDHHKAVLSAEVDEDWAQVELRCYDAGDHDERVLLEASAFAAIHDELDRIRTEMGAATGHKWNRCVFRVTENGGFKLDVSY